MKPMDGELRNQLIKEAKETGNTAMVARRHGVSVTSLYYWLKKENGPGKESGSRRELEKKLLENELENEILKELLKKTNQAWLGDLPVPGYTMNRNGAILPDQMITQVLGDYRSRPEFQNGGGVDKLSAYLKRDYGFYVNRKKIYRLCREDGLLLERRGIKGRRRGGFISRNHVVTRPNQLWEFDVKYGYVHGEGRFFFLLAIEDVFTCNAWVALWGFLVRKEIYALPFERHCAKRMSGQRTV